MMHSRIHYTYTATETEGMHEDEHIIPHFEMDPADKRTRNHAIYNMQWS